MNPKIVIRSETDADVSAITDVTVAAFKTLEISNHTEQFIVEALRAAKALDGIARCRGGWPYNRAYCFLSRDHLGRRSRYGLGPVSVLPTYQRRGIRKALIGLSLLKDMNAQGCCLVGHPDYAIKIWVQKHVGTRV